ncbi:MAG: lipoyl synthase [Endomicrobiales bacterium]|nr:lipoyl synthase [Endomicrobiales bacterium]
MKKKHVNLADISGVLNRFRRSSLNTICESARCPNIGECFARGNATFLILGDSCTRGCGFCAVKNGTPVPLDPSEPFKVAEAIKEMNLKYAVVTSVTRDDLPDGGAAHFAATAAEIRRQNPGILLETLVPDFRGDRNAWKTVFSSRPSVLSHNLETVRGLYGSVRSGADYGRSLELIRSAGSENLLTKSGIMLGLGEQKDGVLGLMDDLIEAGCSILTIGQYLQPSKRSVPVKRYLDENEFEEYREQALSRGFAHCESGPFVRSSYMAHRALEKLELKARIFYN